MHCDNQGDAYQIDRYSNNSQDRSDSRLHQVFFGRPIISSHNHFVSLHSIQFISSHTDFQTFRPHPHCSLSPLVTSGSEWDEMNERKCDGMKWLWDEMHDHRFSRIVVMPIDTPMMPMIRVITGKTLLTKANRRFEPIFSTRRASRHMPASIEKMQANVMNVRAASNLSQRVVPLFGSDRQSNFSQAEAIGLEIQSRHKPAVTTLSSLRCILPLKEKLDRSDASWRVKV